MEMYINPVEKEHRVFLSLVSQDYVFRADAHLSRTLHVFRNVGVQWGEESSRVGFAREAGKGVPSVSSLHLPNTWGGGKAWIRFSMCIVHSPRLSEQGQQQAHCPRNLDERTSRDLGTLPFRRCHLPLSAHFPHPKLCPCSFQSHNGH